MSARPLCFVDTETTSLRNDREVWEVAIIRRDLTDWDETRYHAFVEVDHIENADPKALQIGGFYDRHPQGRALLYGESDFVSLTPKSAVAEKVFAMTYEATVVGAIPSFDTYGLDRLLLHAGMLPGWHYRIKCVESLAQGHIHEPVDGLGWAADLLGIEHDNDHTAMGDAETTMKVYNAVMGEEV